MFYFNFLNYQTDQLIRKLKNIRRGETTLHNTKCAFRELKAQAQVRLPQVQMWVDFHLLQLPEHFHQRLVKRRSPEDFDSVFASNPISNVRGSRCRVL